MGAHQWIIMATGALLRSKTMEITNLATGESVRHCVKWVMKNIMLDRKIFMFSGIHLIK